MDNECLVDNGVISYIGKTERDSLEKGWELDVFFWRRLRDIQVKVSGGKLSMRRNPGESHHLFNSYLVSGQFWFFSSFPCYAVTVTGCVNNLIPTCL